VTDTSIGRTWSRPAKRVKRYTKGMSAKTFTTDEKTRDAVLRNLEIIGEAAKQIPMEARQRVVSIDWRKIIGFRDVVAHAYFGLDDIILWDIVANKIPQLLDGLNRAGERSS
jgi:uncharacterized protein with HEPN domain